VSDNALAVKTYNTAGGTTNVILSVQCVECQDVEIQIVDIEIVVKGPQMGFIVFIHKLSEYTITYVVSIKLTLPLSRSARPFIVPYGAWSHDRNWGDHVTKVSG
jgi:hypothetical protein